MGRTAAFTLIALMAFIACSAGTPTSTAVLTELEVLEQARSRWNANEPAKYQYVIHVRCLACTPNVPGESALVMVDRSGIKRSETQIPNSGLSSMTVAAAFDWVREVIRQDFYRDRDSVYDPVYGYPASIRATGAYGHGVMLTIADFEVIEES